MGAIINLAERRAQSASDGPALSGPAICQACGNEWEAVAPTGVTQLECPECHALKGLWKLFVMPETVDGETAYSWTCLRCNGMIFSISPSKDGPLLYCAGCGERTRAIDVFE